VGGEGGGLAGLLGKEVGVDCFLEEGACAVRRDRGYKRRQEGEVVHHLGALFGKSRGWWWSTFVGLGHCETDACTYSRRRWLRTMLAFGNIQLTQGCMGQCSVPVWAINPRLKCYGACMLFISPHMDVD
jgi:hypothetical protein